MDFFSKSLHLPPDEFAEGFFCQERWVEFGGSRRAAKVFMDALEDQGDVDVGRDGRVP